MIKGLTVGGRIMKDTKIISFEDEHLYNQFVNGACYKAPSCSENLYKLLILLLTDDGIGVNEKDVCQLLIEMNELKLSQEAGAYIEYLIVNGNVQSVTQGIVNNKLYFISKRDCSEDMEVVIVEQNKGFKFKLAKVFKNIISRPQDLTVYDIDFLLIGLLQETENQTIKMFLKHLLEIAKNYPMNIRQSFSESIIYINYDKEHLQFIEEQIKDLHEK